MSPVLVFVVVFLVIYFVQRKWRVFLIGWQLDGPWAIPLVGNVQMISRLQPKYLFMVFTENREKFRNSYRLWLGTQLWVFLHSPEETRDALNDHTLVKPPTFRQLERLLGNGLIISDGKYWETHRKALAPAFNTSVLHSFVACLDEHAAIFVNRLKASAGLPVEVGDEIFPAVLDMVVDTSMGKKLNCQDDPHSIYPHAFHRTSELLFKRMMNPLLAPDFIFERTGLCRQLNASVAVIHQLMEGVIKERAAYLRLQSETANEAGHDDKSQGREHSKQRTLLDTLLTARINGEALTFTEIRDEVNTFVFAGVDTTTAAMGFILYSLAKYPDEQGKLLDEVRQCGAGEADLSMATLNRLEYMDLFIKECLRMYTIVPLTGRETTCDTVIGGRRYCPGITLWINMYGLAHDARYFEQPHEFRPERFGRKQAHKIPPFCNIPFSGGPHVCIGRKYALVMMKILLVRIVANFAVSLSKPDDELILMAQMVLKAENGINLVFKERVE